MITDYQYDLFISYKTHEDWNSWTRDHIYRMLDSYLFDQLDQKPRIFIDDHTQIGDNWVQRIGTALGSSRALIAILSVPYFSSQWCLHELDLMHKRLSSTKGDNILIFPINVSGEGTKSKLPLEIENLQMYDLTEFRIKDIQRGTKAYHKFSVKVKSLCMQIAEALNRAPPFDSSWAEDCKERFNILCHAKNQGMGIPVESLSLKSQPGIPPEPTNKPTVYI